MNAPVGVVVALAAEARCLAGCSVRAGERRDTLGLMIQVAGVGAARATRAGVTLLESGARSLVSFGVAAGLVPGLHAGVLLLPSVVVAADGRRLVTDTAWRARCAACCPLTLRQGPLAEAASVLADSEQKIALAARTGAIAADMESAALLSLAESAGVPAIVVRCVLDPVEQSLPAAALAALREDGSTDLVALALSLLRRPRQLRSLLALAHGNRRALAALTQFADHALDGGSSSDTDDAARHSRQNPSRPNPDRSDKQR